MKKRYTLIIIGLLLKQSLLLNAQQSNYSNVLYDSSQFGIKAVAIVPSFDNGFMIAGEYQYQSGLFIKMDSAGNQIWNKIYNNNNTGISPDIDLKCIVSTNDSCFVLAGSTYNVTSSHLDALVMKVNASGDTIWSKAYNVPNADNCKTISMQQTNDSGYIMAGIIQHVVAPNTEIFITKIDGEGNLQWTKTCAPGGNASYVYAVKQTSDSGYVITGSYEDVSPFNTYGFIAKLSNSGTFLWGVKYYNTSNSFLTFNDFDILSDGFLCSLKSTSEVYLMKTDLTGNFIWQKSYIQIPGNNFVGDPGPKLHKTLDNGYIFVSGDQFSSGGLTKTDTAGNVFWTQNLLLNPAEVLPVNDGGYLVLGNGPLMGVKGSVISPQIGTIKTDSIGNSTNCINQTFVSTTTGSFLSSAMSLTGLSGGTVTSTHPHISSIGIAEIPGCVDLVGGIGENNYDKGILVVPNPSNGMFAFITQEKALSQITIYNAIGESVLQANNDNSEFKIDLSKNAKGIYFYKVLFDDGKMAHGKLVTMY